MCENNKCKCNKNLDFSIREEVRVALVENLPEDIGITIDEIVEELKNDELMLSTIRLCIYLSIQKKLRKKGIENEEVNFQVDNSKEWLLDDYNARMEAEENYDLNETSNGPKDINGNNIRVGDYLIDTKNEGLDGRVEFIDGMCVKLVSVDDWIRDASYHKIK